MSPSPSPSANPHQNLGLLLLLPAMTLKQKHRHLRKGLFFFFFIFFFCHGNWGVKCWKVYVHGTVRRREMKKRVVTIPIGDVDGSKSKGETYPPSDSWAWRKYGQKPIKGSPYPRYLLYYVYHLCRHTFIYLNCFT